MTCSFFSLLLLIEFSLNKKTKTENERRANLLHCVFLELPSFFGILYSSISNKVNHSFCLYAYIVSVELLMSAFRLLLSLILHFLVIIVGV